MRFLVGVALAALFLLFLFGAAEWKLDWPIPSSPLQMSTNRLAIAAKLTVPVDFPTGLAAPLAVEPEENASKHTAFKLNSPDGANASPAQLDPQTRKLWTLREVAPDERGSTLDLSAVAEAAEPTMKIIRKPGGFLFSQLERPVLFYQEAAKSLDDKYLRANYAHPLYGLDGEILTQDFPEDHLHHRGVFWAWHQLLVDELRAGDPWLTKDFLCVVRKAEVVSEGPVFAALRLNVLWTSSRFVDSAGRPRPIVEERTTIRVFRSSRDSQCVDFEIALKPLVSGLRLGGAENSRGYSGFTVRVKPPAGGVIQDSIGILVQDRIGEASPWADYSGQFGKGDRVSGIAILSHPGLPEFPPKWVLRHYGMINVAYPGRHAVPIPQDSLLVLRHRVLVHRGTQSQARVADHQQIYETVQ